MTTRMSLSSPASWAAETNFQSRYPGGIVVPMICLAALLSVWVLVSADRGAIHATRPATVDAARNETNAIRFMAPSCWSRDDSQTLFQAYRRLFRLARSSIRGIEHPPQNST